MPVHLHLRHVSNGLISVELTELPVLLSGVEVNVLRLVQIP